MEIMLAAVAVIAVVFFGALMSAGNERQRKAIDGLREQIVLWSLQDLRIKHERLARDVQVPDPLGWLNKVASKVCGYDLNLRIIKVFDEPQSLVCQSGVNTSTIMFTSLSPVELCNIKKSKHSRLAQFADHNPVLSLPRGVKIHEMSALNSGILFDLEMPLAWKGLTGQRSESISRLWMFVYP